MENPGTDEEATEEVPSFEATTGKPVKPEPVEEPATEESAKPEPVEEPVAVPAAPTSPSISGAKRGREKEDLWSNWKPSSTNWDGHEFSGEQRGPRRKRRSSREPRHQQKNGEEEKRIFHSEEVLLQWQFKYAKPGWQPLGLLQVGFKIRSWDLPPKGKEDRPELEDWWI